MEAIVNIPKNLIDKEVLKKIRLLEKENKSLEEKLSRRDVKIYNLKRENERLKGVIMLENKSKECLLIAKLAQTLVNELNNANWICLSDLDNFHEHFEEY